MRTSTTIVSGLVAIAAAVTPSSLRTQEPALMNASHVSTAAADADADIRALIAAQADAWNRHDAAGWASAFTPGAEFINILGTPFNGKPAIEGITARIFSSFFKLTRDSVTVQNVVLVTPDVAYAQFEHAVSGYTALPAGILPSEPGADGKGVLRTRMTYVLHRTGDHEWSIVHGQNTAILPPAKLP